jgi:ATP-dependent Clp protease adaptor protein ClpS
MDFEISTKEEVSVKKPRDFAVVLMNDDYTPMEFVVEVLRDIFGKDESKSEAIMMEIHTNGQGVAGVYNFDIAETKAVQVMDLARKRDFPLVANLVEVE